MCTELPASMHKLSRRNILHTNAGVQRETQASSRHHFEAPRAFAQRLETVWSQAAGCYCKALQHPLPFVLFVMEKCNQRPPTSTRRLYYTVYSILPTVRNGCLARTKSLVLRVPAYVCTSTTRKVNRSTCPGATARNTVEHTAKLN